MKAFLSGIACRIAMVGTRPSLIQVIDLYHLVEAIPPSTPYTRCRPNGVDAARGRWSAGCKAVPGPQIVSRDSGKVHPPGVWIGDLRFVEIWSTYRAQSLQYKQLRRSKRVPDSLAAVSTCAWMKVTAVFSRRPYPHRTAHHSSRAIFLSGCWLYPSQEGELDSHEGATLPPMDVWRHQNFFKI